MIVTRILFDFSPGFALSKESLPFTRYSVNRALLLSQPCGKAGLILVLMPSFLTSPINWHQLLSTNSNSTMKRILFNLESRGTQHLVPEWVARLVSSFCQKRIVYHCLMALPWLRIQPGDVCGLRLTLTSCSSLCVMKHSTNLATPLWLVASFFNLTSSINTQQENRKFHSTTTLLHYLCCLPSTKSW